MTTIASILSAEQAAFQALQIASGTYAGAIATYWLADPNTGPQSVSANLYSAYSASRGLALAMLGFIKNGQTVPTWLMNMVSSYISFEMAALPWSQSVATSTGTDSTGHAFAVGDYLMATRGGSVYALRWDYRNSIMGHQGQVSKTYSAGSGAGSYAQAVANVQSLFIKGCPLTKWGTSSGAVLPGWVTERADYSFTTPLDKMVTHQAEFGYCTASQSGTVVNVTTAPTGGHLIGIGDCFYFGNGNQYGATVTSLGTGTGGVGTYNVDVSQSQASTSRLLVASYSWQQYHSLDYHFYDANDSAGACFVALIALWLKQQSDASISTWLRATVNGSTNWEALNWIMAASYVNYDPNTNLPFAAPFTRASFTQDTVEVIEGVRGFCWIVNEMLGYDPATFNTYSAGGFSMTAMRTQWGNTEKRLNQAVLSHCFNSDGTLNNGWNGDPGSNITVGTPADTHQDRLESWISAWICGFDYSVPLNWRNSPDVDLAYFNIAKAQNNGNGFPTTSAWYPTATFPDLYGPQIGVNVPGVYMYLSMAAQIGSPDAPFTRSQFETFVNAVYSANTASTPNRTYTIWWVLDSAALMWMCQTLIAKGST